ncbi:MAG: TrkH family potassium uptake protein [Nocardioidaceae bacterium]
MLRTLSHPARLVPVAFLVVVTIGAVLLMLPVSRADDSGPVVLPAAFTSVGALTGGMVLVDTATFWTPFGQAVILALIQIGGFGIMTLATTLVLLVNHRLGLRTTLVAQAETAVNLGEVRHILRRIVAVTVLIEAATALVLTLRYWIGHDYSFGTSAWHGVFHSVSAFNNAGFMLESGNLVGFVDDAWVIVPMCFAAIAGGIGFPVLVELIRRAGRPSQWTVHTRLTVYGSAVLLFIGTAAFLAFEWGNDDTIGPLGPGGKLLAAFTGSVMPRTAGFNSIDYSGVASETLAVTDVLMFIGAGSAGTAGGIKVSTFFLLAFVIWAEVRAEQDVNVAHRRISSATQRQALTVALLSVGVIASGTIAMLTLTDDPFDGVLFESISAFSTVGLSTGITPGLPDSAQVVVMALMFIGRVGPITAASALALRSRHRLYKLPEERPIVG